MLRMRLFGSLEVELVELDGAPVEQRVSRRAWGLLAWLALHPGMSAPARVAACFWPDVLDSSARASLLSAIWVLRRALGPAGDAYLRVTRDTVGLDQAGQLWVDVAAFDELVAAGRLQEAAELAGGELLAGLTNGCCKPARSGTPSSPSSSNSSLCRQKTRATRRRRSAGRAASCRLTRSPRNRSAG